MAHRDRAPESRALSHGRQDEVGGVTRAPLGPWGWRHRPMGAHEGSGLAEGMAGWALAESTAGWALAERGVRLRGAQLRQG